MSQTFAEALSWVPVSATFSGTLGRAHEYARAQGHRLVTLEHMLLALADDPDASTVLQASNIDIARVMSDASTHLGHNEDRFAAGQLVDPGADEALIRILDYAAAAARQSRRREINGAIVLAAIVGEGRSVAASMLQAQGLTFEGAIRALQRAPAATPRPQAPTPSAPSHVAPQPAVPATVPVAVPTAVAEDTPTAINGVASQTNEQILASVRRRIDANRHSTKASTGPVPATPAPIPYAAPPSPTVSVAPPEPIRLPDPPRTSPPVTSPEPAHPPVLRSPHGEDGYNGLYPEPSILPDPGPPPASARSPSHDDGLRREAYDPGIAYPSSDYPSASAEVDAPRPPPAMFEPAYQMPPPQMTPHDPPTRPRQLGAPVVPPSSVPWPEPVRPQPAALPPSLGPPPPIRPNSAPPQPRYREPDPFDGGIAGAPYPEPDSVPPAPVMRQTAPHLPSAATTPAPVSSRSPVAASIDPGQLAENIPRKMRVGQTETIEVRIGRAEVRNLADGMRGSTTSYLHDLVVTKAMSVRLRAVDGGFNIEGASPETQWIDNHMSANADDFASWRWNVTPTRHGTGRLQLVVSARTVASDGLSADTALPDQVIEVAVQADYARLAKRAAGWAGLMILGGVLSRLGQGGFETVAAIWRGFQ